MKSLAQKIANWRICRQNHATSSIPGLLLLLMLWVPLGRLNALSANEIATAKSDSFSCSMEFKLGVAEEPSTLRVYATSNAGDEERRALAKYVSADKQGYIRFHEPDVVEFAEGSRKDGYAEIGAMLVNLSTWKGPEIQFSDAAEYDSVANGYFLRPVIDGERVALVTQISQQRHRFYRIRVWEPIGSEWHESFVLGAKDVSVSFFAGNELQVRIDWGENRTEDYMLNIMKNRFEVR